MITSVLPKIGILIFLIIGFKAAQDMFFHLEIALLDFATMSPTAATMRFIQSSLVSIIIFGISIFATIKFIGMVTRKASVHQTDYDLAKEPAPAEHSQASSDFDADEVLARYMSRQGNIAHDQTPKHGANSVAGFGRKGT